VVSNGGYIGVTAAVGATAAAGQFTGGWGTNVEGTEAAAALKKILWSVQWDSLGVSTLQICAHPAADCSQLQWFENKHSVC
jgi:hypothetical protein